MQNLGLQASQKIQMRHVKLGSQLNQIDRDVAGDDFLLQVPLSQGRVSIEVNGNTLHNGIAAPGMMRISSPGEREHITVHKHFEALWLLIPGPRLRAILQANNGNHRPDTSSFIRALLHPRTDVYQLARLVLSQSEFDPAYAQLSVNGITDALLARLLQHHGAAFNSTRVGDKMTANELKRCFEIAEAYMESGIELDRWAAQLGMPGPEFSRRFRLTIGQPAYAWFMERRIERAKRELLETKDPLCDIAFKVGFSSQSHFTEAFRRRIGTSPARWRAAQISSHVKLPENLRTHEKFDK